MHLAPQKWCWFVFGCLISRHSGARHLGIHDHTWVQVGPDSVLGATADSHAFGREHRPVKRQPTDKIHFARLKDGLNQRRGFLRILAITILLTRCPKAWPSRVLLLIRPPANAF